MAKFFTSILFLVLMTRVALAQAQLGFDGFEWNKDYPPWIRAQCFELGLDANYQFALAKPEHLGGGQSLSVTADAKYLWSYAIGMGWIGPSLRLGLYHAHGTDETLGEGMSASSFMLEPGVFNANYVGINWLFINRISLPLVQFEPGFVYEVGASHIFSDVVRIEFGLSLGYYQTNLEVAGKEIDWFSMGPYISGTFELYGDYVSF